MDLIAAYLYNNPAIRMTEIWGTPTFERMIDHEWFEDERQPKGFKIMNKRFKINDQHYRCILRFRHDYGTIYQLDSPIPFAVVLSERIEIQKTYGTESRFKDLKVWHARDMKNTNGYLQHGVPAQLIETIIGDLTKCLVYHDESDVGGDKKSNTRRPVLMMGISEEE